MSKSAKKPPAQKRALRRPYRPDEVSGHVSLTHQKLMGRVIIAWSKLEATLHDVVWKFFGIDDDDGRILTGKQDAKHLIIMIKALSKRHLEKGLAEQLRILLTHIETVYGDRNFIVHGNWGSTVSEGVPIAASLRQKSEVGIYASEEFPSDRMHRILHRIQAAKISLLALSDGLPTLRGKPPAQPAEK